MQALELLVWKRCLVAAKQVDFVELSNVASSALNNNLKKLPIEQDQIAKVEQMSSFDWSDVIKITHKQ